MVISFNPLHSQGFNAVSIPDETFVIATGDSGKIFKSFDSGLSWQSTNVASVNFNSLSSKGLYSYLTASDSKVYRIYSVFNSPVSIFTISGNHIFNSVHFISDSTGFICGQNGAVFKTTNAGINWSSKSSGISAFNLNSISFMDVNNGVIAADEGNIFITTNSGNSWTTATPVPLSTNKLLKVKYFDDGIVAVGEYGTLIVKRNDSPEWKSINTRVTSDIRGIAGSGIDDVHVCGGGGFIRNNKNNNIGFTNFEPNPMMANLVDVCILNSQIGYAVSNLNKAIVKTTNGGQSWSFTQGISPIYRWERKETTHGGFGNTLCRHPTDKKSFFCGLGNRVFVSRDEGEEWNDIAGVPGVSMHSLYVSPLDTNVWMCAISGAPDRIMRTTNYGQNWTTSISGTFSAYGQPLEMDQNNPSVYYYAPDGGGFYKSSDEGITFELISNHPFRSPCDIIIMWDSSQVIFVGDGPPDQSGSKIFRSSDGGFNWNLVLENHTASEIPSMCNSVFEKNILYATEVSDDFWRSTDYGLTFSSLYRVGFVNWASAVCEEDPNLILDGLFNSSCYFSLNKGIDWNYSTGPNSFTGLGLLAPSKNILLYYTSQGIYKLKVTYNGVVSVNENIISSNIPQAFLLHQNYPNPFNPLTTIRFDLPASGNIIFKIYDMSGKEINTVFQGFKNAGSYEVSFDGSDFSSGIYFYRIVIHSDKLISETLSVTKKMMLLK